MKLKSLIPISAALLLASCAAPTPSSEPTPAPSSEPPAPSSSEPAPSSEPASISSDTWEQDTTPVSIEFMSNTSYGDNIDSYIAAFQAQYPWITVTNKKESADYQGVIDKVIEGIPANNYPDIVVGYPDAIEGIMEAGKLVKLDKWIDDPHVGWSEDDLDDIIETYLEEGRQYPRSGTFSLPFSKSTEAMFYNKDVLIGLDLSAIDATINAGNPITEDYLNDLTWEELFDKLCPAIVTYNNGLDDEHKILKDDPNYSKAVVGYDSDDNFFITLAEQYGYPYTSINEYGEGSIDFVNDGMKGLVKKLREYYDKGYLITKGSSKGGNYTNYSFTAGAALFTVGSTGGLKYQVCDDFETAIAPLPYPEGKTRKLISQGPSLALLNHGDEHRVEAAWLFAKFITNVQNSLDWAVNTGYLPIRYSVSASAAYRTAIEEGLLEDVHSLDHLKAVCAQYVGNAAFVGDCLYGSPVFKGSAAARTQVGGTIVTSLLTMAADKYNDAAVDTAFETAKSNTLKAMND